MTQAQFTPKQEMFIVWYVKLLNATRAAGRAGYGGDRHTLEEQGSRLLRNVEIRAEIDRLLREKIMSADELLGRVTDTAVADVTPYIGADGRLDVQALAADGLGHLVVGVKPGREGVEYALASPQVARKLLARYHRLLGDRVDVDISGTATLDKAALDTLAAQIGSIIQHETEQNETEDSTE